MEVETSWRHMLMMVLGTLPLLLLPHVKELEHHVLHEIIEELLVRSVALLGPSIFKSVIVIFRVKSVRKLAKLTDPWTADPFDTFFVLLSLLLLRIRNTLSSNHQLLIARVLKRNFGLTVRSLCLS
jgi:hypothetical protein